jgi:hypothetical protein
MKQSTLIAAFLFFNLSFIVSSQAQCDTIASVCAQYITSPFISDGQQYRALLISGQTAEFHATFYGGGTYRIAACTGFKEGNLIFSVFDEQRNMLFTNKEYKNSPYWDFQVTSTMDIVVEATLDGAPSGCAVVLIGFKQ